MPKSIRLAALERGRWLLLLPFLVAPGCRASDSAGEAAGDDSPAILDASAHDAGPMDEAETRARTIAAVEAGKFEEARALLDDLLRGEHLAAARSLLAAGDPEDALDQVDRVLEVDARDADGQLLKADGSLVLAVKGIATGANGTLIEGSLQDALEYYKRSAENEPRAIIGATRAATMLGETEEALAWARRGNEQLAIAEIATEPGTQSPRHTIAEAIVRAYTEAKSAALALAPPPADAEETDEAAGTESDSSANEVAAPEPTAEQLAAEAHADELFAEAELALGNLLGREADDAWAWGKLSDLYEWEQRYGDARARLVDGLARLPEDAGLMARLARVARNEDGREHVIALFEAFEAQNPSNALGHWYLGFERFEHAVDRMTQEQVYDADALKVAEADFVRCRELDPNTASACLAYEVMCRNARGWCAFNEDDLELAQKEFLSMNDVFERGVEWELAGRLRSGVMGLAFVGDQYNNRHENLPAALAFELAHQLEKDSADWANNAGFFLRDASVDAEIEGKRLCRAAHGTTTDATALAELRTLAGVDAALAGTDAERAAFRTAANEKLALARDLMERSWLAYEVAAELNPEDVRTVNDAGLVLVYYTHNRLETAEELLLKAAALGDEQVPAFRKRIEESDASEDELLDLKDDLLVLEEAWGDAYQNLAVLEWLHKGNNEKAVAYAERSVEIGPDPRPFLKNNLIPLLVGGRETEGVEYFLDLRDWGHDCE